MATPLWSPSVERIEQTNIWNFIQYINKQHNESFHDYASLYQWSIEHPSLFWPAVWEFCGIKASQPWDHVFIKAAALENCQWFTGSQLNFAENLLRFSQGEYKEHPAIIFWGEDHVKRELSYGELFANVAQLAQFLKEAGVGEGDRVAAFMPNLPETVIAMLATTSLGAVWSSCSPDFGFNGVLDRFGQIEPKVLFSADGYFFKGKPIDSLATVRKLASTLPSLQHIVVVPYVNQQPDISGLSHCILYSDALSGRDSSTIHFSQLPFDHPLYIMFSSGTTGKPKCIVHGAGGTLIQHLKELVLHTDLKPGERIFYFTTCGWMMWNWLVSSLATGATLLLYDGNPFHPHPGILFDFAEQTGMNVFGTSAKYLSALEKAGVKPKQTHDLSALRCLLSTGSPLAPESFDMVYRDIKADIQLASISGGTDIISCFALGNPMIPVYRGELQCRGLGMSVDVVDTTGQSIRNEKGELVCTTAFPSMPIYFWNDPDKKKYHSTYFSQFPEMWAQGDFAELTDHDGLIIFGRSDAVLNPGGVRIGTAEIYRQVEKHPEVLESIAVGQSWQNDTRVILFVKLREINCLDEALISKIKSTIRENTTPRHVPAKIIQVSDIPRTISGKIVELAVRNVIEKQPVVNIDALANPEALNYFKDRPELDSE